MRVLLGLLLVCVVCSEMALTPFGYLPKECVHHVREDEVASFDDVDEMFRIRRRVTLENGKDDYQIVEEYPRCESEPVKPQGSRAEPNGWAAYALWLTNIPLTEFGGEWSVPSNPTQEGLQTLFLFTGLQNAYSREVSIIQPVLQWGSSEAGDSKTWEIASWFVGGSHASYSDLVGPCSPGDTIVGNMTLNSSGQWQIITADQNNGLTTTLTVLTGVTEIDAFVTLEVYGIDTCSDYPNGQDTFSSLWLESNGVVQYADWTSQTEPDCSEAVTINSATSVTIKF